MTRPIIFAVLLTILQACGIKQGIQTEAQTEIFRDDFNTNINEWAESTEANTEKFFRDGHYHIINTESGWVTWSTININLDPSEDFIIETSVALNWHTMGSAYLLYGVDQTNSDFHYMSIVKVDNIVNSVSIGKRIDGQWTSETKDARLAPYGQQNILKVQKRGDILTFSANNRVVHRQEFEPFLGNRIGVGCGDNQSVSFDYLVVKQDN